MASLDETESKKDITIIKVNNRKYNIEKDKLLKYPDTLLGKMVKDNNKETVIVLDRYIASIDCILHFYEHGFIKVPSDIMYDNFIEELNFLLMPLPISPDIYGIDKNFLKLEDDKKNHKIKLLSEMKKSMTEQIVHWTEKVSSLKDDIHSLSKIEKIMRIKNKNDIVYIPIECKTSKVKEYKPMIETIRPNLDNYDNEHDRDSQYARDEMNNSNYYIETVDSKFVTDEAKDEYEFFKNVFGDKNIRIIKLYNVVNSVELRDVYFSRATHVPNKEIIASYTSFGTSTYTDTPSKILIPKIQKTLLDNILNSLDAESVACSYSEIIEKSNKKFNYDHSILFPNGDNNGRELPWHSRSFYTQTLTCTYVVEIKCY